MPQTTKGAWKLQEVRDAVLSGQWITYNVSNDPGTLWGWGYNSYGIIGDGTIICRSSPVQIPGTSWLKLSSQRHSHGIKSDGTLWAWGAGSGGRLGDNSTISKCSPNQIPGTTWLCVTNGVRDGFAIKSDRTLWAWGNDVAGSLAQGAAPAPAQGGIYPRSSPVQIPGNTWCKVSAGSQVEFVAAVKTDGTLWAWGSGTNGTLAQGTYTHRSSPVQITGTGWCDVSAGGSHGLALKTDGTLWGWGTGTSGQIGDSTLINRLGPGTVQIPGTSWTAIYSSTYSSLARKTDGTLWGWGRNTSPSVGGGFLGDNTVIARCSPVQIPGTTWNEVAMGCESSAARKTDGTVWTWGDGTRGQIGDNATIHRSSPVQVPGTSWISVNIKGRTVLARKSS